MKPNTKLSAHQIFLKSIVFVGILIGFFISIDLCIPGELDPENRLKYRDFVETMDPLIGPLHKIHVDVCYNSLKYLSNNKKPIITKLENMPFDLDNARFNKMMFKKNNIWTADFMNEVGFLVFSKFANKEEWQNADKTEDFDKLLEVWKNTDADKRIFLCFTSEDYSTAKNVAGVFKQTDHLVFLYLKDKMKRTFPPAITGKFFNTASQRLVLDSFNARQSDGIYFEFRIHQEQLIDGEYLYYKEKKGESFDLFGDLPSIEEEEKNRKKKKLSKAKLYQKAWKEQERKEIRYRLEISGGITINDTPEIIEKKIEKKIEYLNKNRKPLIDQYIRSSKFKK